MKDISTTYYTANDQNCSTVNDREIDQSELENNAIAHSYMDAIYLYGHMLHQTGYQQTNASLFLNEFRNQTIEYEKENKTIIMDINGDQASKLALFCANKDGSWHVCLVGVSFLHHWSNQIITYSYKMTVVMLETCVGPKKYVCLPTNMICHEHPSSTLFKLHEIPFQSQKLLLIMQE